MTREKTTSLVVQRSAVVLPAVITGAGERAGRRFVEFFTANIRNINTRTAYARAIGDFFVWLDERAVTLERIEPVIVAAYIEQLGQTKSAPTVKQALAAIRMLFNWMVVGQILPMNPSSPAKSSNAAESKDFPAINSIALLRRLEAKPAAKDSAKAANGSGRWARRRGLL